MTTGKGFSRRTFFKYGGAAVVAGGALGTVGLSNVLRPSLALAQTGGDADLELVGTDGWIYLPPDPPIGVFHPDNLAPPGLTTYVFGFRNVTGMPASFDRTNLKNHAQHSAPMFWSRVDDTFRVRLSNVGLAQRPDLFDAHSVHWHGFRNVIPLFDGEPTGSIAVTSGNSFTYVYRPKPGGAGTYMYHCHVEDTEHVQMGMTGMVFIRPAIGDNFVYDTPESTNSTGFDREYAMILSEVWAEAHWDDAHIQLPEWSDYRADFALLNGRTYPDTVAPHCDLDTSDLSTPYVNFVRDPDTGEMTPPSGTNLQYQPLSSLITCNAGDKVLLRMANLGYKQSAMTLTGIRMRVVGKDATPLFGRDSGGVDNTYETNTIMLGAGESSEGIFTAPDHVGPDPYDTYLLYNRAYLRSNNLASGATSDPRDGLGGQVTEVRVYPASTLGPQAFPNDYEGLG
jgi:FtsP/CotA-like multicopper oxidase with cupredoxin domain